ncbi:MAG: tRNA(Met) cytidine acetyltransferase [Thiomicrorhabdus sp.]|nr:MAG: tRNA(Met) cytidine acetyltransferase [Thiomicrorhabdus sp.]
MNKSSPLKLLRQALKKHHHRALVILSGSSSWQNLLLQNLWEERESVLWLTETDENPLSQQSSARIKNMPTKQLAHLLGQEVDSVVFNVVDGLNANALGISAGMIRAGGLLILLTPETAKWQTLVNPDNQRFLSSPYQIDQALPYFTEHLIQQWQQSDSTSTVWLSEQQNEQQNEQALQNFLQTYQNSPPPAQIKLPTNCQLSAITAIHSVAFGHRKRPLVVSADRGRGKSSLLGLSAIKCLIEGKDHIVLTASRLDQAKMAITHALQALAEHIGVHKQQPNRIQFHYQGQLKVFEFIAPDQLILQPSKADLVMVDEAAHLPTPLLTQLLERHHRMVFATTLHGYEGSGRGFELRFKKTLNQLTPDWKNIHLKEAIRWSENDPLEQAINQALLLSPMDHADHADQEGKEGKEGKEEMEQLATQLTSSDLDLKLIETASLLANPEQLHALFDLLVQAHYQTSPNDLQQLLNAPNLKIITAQVDQKLVGVMLCVEEGKTLYQGKRLHGHLTPQLLIKNYATPDFMMLSSWRVMRIAVSPKIQRHGIGKELLNYLQQIAQAAKIDYLSSSFGASDELLPFWFAQNYKPLHIGIKRDKSSGCHNLLVAKALTSMAQQAIACNQRAFQAQFPHILIESLPYLSAGMSLAILKSFRFSTLKPQFEEAANLYKNSERHYESISGLLWEWSIRNPAILALANVEEQAVWCDKVLKKQDWKTVADTYQLAGRHGVESVMQAMLNRVLTTQPELMALGSYKIKSNFGKPQ